MQLTDQLALIDIFMREAMAKRHEAHRIVEFRRLEDREEKEAKQKKHEKALLQEFEEAVRATTEQLDTFYRNLDAYDTATVRALMDNDRALDELRHGQQKLEASAYRLPDGRLAFKTQDGTQVFDRQGTHLSRDIVEPDSIPNSATRWEAMKADVDAEQKLVQERQDILRYQQRLDEARETVDKGNMSAGALARLDADLKQSMPGAVRLHIQPVPVDASPDFEVRVGPLSNPQRPSSFIAQTPGGP